MNVLFVCNQNQNRSKTAEELFRDSLHARSAGLYNEHPITEKQLAWADVVFVMEEEQSDELAKRFPKLWFQKRIISLDIPDTYYYQQPALVEVLKSKVTEAIPRIA